MVPSGCPTLQASPADHCEEMELPVQAAPDRPRLQQVSRGAEARGMGPPENRHFESFMSMHRRIAYCSHS